MKETLRKTISLLTAAAALITGCVLLGSVLKSYSHTVPVVIGPQRQAALTLLFTLLIVSLGFYFRPLNKRTFFGTLCIAFSVLWFTAKMFLESRGDDNTLTLFLSRWMPIPLIAFVAVAALWRG